ncbi:MAG: PEGA domain-containing protein [Betaproteobacteria bacterium]|nr:PEGA domain-containing protein [Betaproteobacteria bacterium]
MLSIFWRAGLARRELVCAAVVVLGGCASGGIRVHDKLVIDSEPQGARVYITGREVGVTPATVVIDEAFPKHWTTRVDPDEPGFAYYRRLETVDLKKDGCETVTRKLYGEELQREVVKFTLKCDPDYKPAPARAAGSVEERLRALDELRRKGLVTDQEYGSQRQRILGDL